MNSQILQVRKAKGKYYSAERNIQILISLLKANGIKRVIVSPGATNVTFVGSLQYDSFFELYSCVDERSAAYMAIGMSEESSEPVVLSCTGATSSREYIPALTAAYYHKLPILVVTSSQSNSRIGQLVAQVTDRRNPPKDAVIASFQVESVNTQNDEWDRMLKCNAAISCLSANGGGPVHINLITNYCKDFSVKRLPDVNRIERIDINDVFPEIPQGKIGVYIGSHRQFSEIEVQTIDDFCMTNNAVVFCDLTSNYYGKFRVQAVLSLAQQSWRSYAVPLDLLIHIGNISGDYTPSKLAPKQVGRVAEDGIIRDQFHRLTHLFYMPEMLFFRHYTGNLAKDDSFKRIMLQENEHILNLIPELPFGNIWVAQQTARRLPKGSCVHFGILNSLRSWNYFNLAEGIESMCNVGGFGIDGIISTLIGASLSNPHRLYYGVLGDLSFFYDMNALASGLPGKNIRLLVINNGIGAEFRLYTHPANSFGDAANSYMAAAGHNGNKSRVLIKDYVENLGYEYIKASTKEEYLKHLNYFCKAEITNKPIVFEVFTNHTDESDALRIITNIAINPKLFAINKIRKIVKSILGERVLNIIKKF